MAGVPEGFRRVNFNCPDHLFEFIEKERKKANKSLSRYILALISDEASSPVRLLQQAELPEEIQILLGEGHELPAAEEHVSLGSRLD